MSDYLQEVLAMSRTALEEGLAKARIELDELRARQTRVEDAIAQAEAALRLSDGQSESTSAPKTMHEALAQILEEHGNRWMTVRELADEVNQRALYRKRDGTPVEPNQVHARTKNYTKLFDKDGSRVRLRGSATDWDVVIFRDDDDGFFSWQDQHSDGFFINTERNPSPNYLVLHMPGCGHFKGAPSVHWTKDYIKVCAESRPELERWADESVGGEVTLCRSCFG
jgi:hypothetical protein